MHGPDLQTLLRRHFGYDGFRPGQEEIVRACVEGRDAIGVLPTGGGKSVCFQLPAFVLPGIIVVVSPLISLMEDQVERARESGLRAFLLNSTLDRGASDRVLREGAAGRIDLLFLAPERFHVAAFREALASFRVSLLAIDEAHCISQWGHDFRPEYSTLGTVRETLGVPVMALTATATPLVREEIESSLRMSAPVRVVSSFDRPNLSWSVLQAGRHGRRILLLHRLLRRRSGGAAVIYASTRRSVEAVRKDLARLGHLVRSYHAGMEPGSRSAMQEAFLRGDVRVIVATNAFGMGIDKPDVRLVAHYHLPGSVEAYYQEAGRAGRDSEPADCVALYDRRDLKIHRRFAATTHPPARTLRKLHCYLRQAIGEGERGIVDPREAARAMAGSAGFREGVAGIRALERTGSLRVFACPEPGAEAPGAAVMADVGLHSGTLDAGMERALLTRSLERLAAVARFARARSCRRAVLLSYFGEAATAGACGRCDRCAPGLLSPSGLR